MKKFISLLTVFIMLVTMSSVSVFAENNYNEYFGVIHDANGEVVEVIPMPRANYVDTIITIPAGGNWVTYQYKPTKTFSIGFMFEKPAGTVVTTRNQSVILSIYNSPIVGADEKKLVVEKKFSTNSEDNVDKPWDDGTAVFGISCSSNSARPYCNGVYTNPSSTSPLTIRIVVSMD